MRKANYTSPKTMQLKISNTALLHTDANVNNNSTTWWHKLLVVMLILAFSFKAQSQISVTATAGTTGPTSYTTLKGAFDAINAGTHQGAITISVTGNTTETATASLNTSASPSSYTSVLIKPTTTATISGNLNAAAVIKLNGADYVTIDGSIATGGSTRDLTISNTGASAAADNTTGIWLSAVSSTDAATNNTIKNCNVNCTNRIVAYAAIFSGGATITSAASGSNNTNTYTNNALSRARNGLLLAGRASTPYDAGTTINNNNIDSIGSVAVTLSNETNYNVYSNVIDKCEGAAGFASHMRAFSLGAYHLNGNLYNNTVKMVRCSHTGNAGAVANYFLLNSTNTAANVSIYNNNCSGAWSYGTTGNISMYSLHIAAGGGYKIYHNTFQANENPTNTSTFQIMLGFASALTTANSIDIRNNIFSISNNATNNYVVYDFHTAANASVFRGLFVNSDYNAYYTNGSTFGYGIGGVISNYQNTTQKDANSVFPTASNPFSFTSIYDGHLQLNSSNTILNNAGTPISTVATDVDGNNRSRIYPDIGCDEIVYTPKISSFTPMNACIGNTVNIYGADLNASGSTVSLAVSAPSSTNLYKTDTIYAVVAGGYTSPSIGAVTVTNSYGTATSSSNLTRVAPGTVSLLSLTTGSVGDQVLITGTNLTGASSVTFNGTTASFTVTNSTEIQATVPSGATTGSVLVTDACGNVINAGSFTVVAASPCTTPGSQGTGFSATINSTGLAGSFTAASGAPSGYLVIYSTTALTASPSNGTTYTTGYDAVLGGTINQVSASTSVTISGLASNTTYTVTVFAYNGGGCTGGPLYNTTSPLTYTFTTCASTPTGITATPSVSGGGNIATISWTAPTGGGANSLSYGLEVYTDAAYTTQVSGSPFSTSSVSQVVSSLNFDTKYYYKLRSNNGCYSSYATGNFTTLCGAGTVLPSTQNFDASTNVPNCWTIIDNNADSYTWYISTPFNATGLGNPYVLDYDVNSSAGTATTIPADDWAISPGFQLTGGIKYAVSFLQATSGATENLTVKWGNAASSAGMSATNNSGLIYSGVGLSNRAAAARFNTFTPSSTGTYYIGFYTNSPSAASGGRYHYIDNFKIEVAPPAPTTPSAINFTGITSSSITVNWADNSSNEVGFYVYISSDGGSTYTLATTVAANVTTATIGNLNALTQYYFKVVAYNYGDVSGDLIGNATTLSCGGTYATNTYIGTFPIGYGARKFWSTAANWSLGRAPLACDDVVITLSNSNIDTSSSDYSRLYLDQNATIHSLTINGVCSKPVNAAGSSQTLIIFVNGYGLNITGDLNMSLDTAAGTVTGQHGIYLLAGAGTGGTVTNGKISIGGTTNVGVTGTRPSHIGGFGSANNWYFYGNVNLGDQARYNYAEGSDFYFEKGGSQTLTSNSSIFYTPLSTYGIRNFNVGTITPTNLTLAGSTSAYTSRIYDNITIGNNSSLTMPSGTPLNRTQAGGGTITLGNGATLTIGGSTLGITGSNFPNNFANYSFANNSTVVFNGSSAQTVPSDPVYGNLTINNTAGVSVNGNTTVNNTLALTNGIVSTSSNKITLGAGATLTGANSSNYINGTLAKTIASATSSVNFEIGDASNYTPVAVSFAGGSTNSGGILSAKTTAGMPSALGFTRSGISPTNYLNRTYTLSNTGVTGFSTISPTFNYASGDLVGSASNSTYVVSDSVYAGGWAIRSTSNSTSTSSTATGAVLSSGSTADYLLGQIDPPPAPTVDNLVNTSICEGTTFTITGTNFYAVSSVTIGSTSVPFTVNSSTQITVSLPVGTGNGAITVTNATASATTGNSLTTKDQPQTTVTPSNQTICSGSALTTIVLGNTNNVAGTTYSWTRTGSNISGGTNSSSGTTDITGTLESSSTVTETITYTVNSDAAGCAGTVAVATVNVKASPGTVSVTPSSATICQNTAQDLTGSYTAATGSSTTNSGTISVAIPDNNVTGSSAAITVNTVPSGAVVTGIEVSFSATHTYNSDVAFNLVAPNGKIINLVYQKGGAGANFLNTTFTNDAIDNLPTATTNDITGTYMPDALIPVGPTIYSSNTTVISDLYSVPNGTWRLAARDYFAGDDGTITNFSVKLNYTLNPTFSWSAVGGGYAGLYTDAGFTAYTGGNQSVVYVKNAPGSYNYTANLSFNGCTASSDPVNIVIDPVPVTSTGTTSQTICSGANIADIVNTSSDPAASITWTRDHTSDISGIAASGTGNITGALVNTTAAPITVTFSITSTGTGAAACSGNTVTSTVVVNPIPLATVTPLNQDVCSGTAINPLIFSTTNGVAGTTFTWTRDNTTAATGIASSGTAFVSGTLNNTSSETTVTFAITAVGPSPSFCAGSPATATVNVKNPATIYSVSGSGHYCSPAVSGLSVGLSNSQTGYNYQLYKDGIASGSPVAGTGTALDFGLQTDGTYTIVGLSGTCARTMTGNAVITSSSSATPTIDISTASTTVCSGSNVVFSSNITNGGSTPSYVWKKNGSTISGATNSSYTAPSGSLASNDVITCVLTSSNPCTPSPITSNSITLVVNPSPAIPAISDATGAYPSTVVMCTIGSTKNLYCFSSNGVGSWSSSNASTATVVPGMAGVDIHYKTGVITAVAIGTSIISYTLPSANGCSSSSSVLLKVSAVPTPASITGASAFCVGSTATYATTATGGTWVSMPRYTITSGGVATGTSAGTTEIRYLITNSDGCSNYSSLPITVNALPGIPSISYAPGTSSPQTTGGICTNRSFTLVGTPTGGAWSGLGLCVTNGTAPNCNINSSTGATYTGLSGGPGGVKYTVTNSTTGCSNSRTINMNVVVCIPKGANYEPSNLVNDNNFTLYPNPSNQGHVNIKLDKLVGDGQVVITNVLGKKVISQQLSLGNNIIYTQNLSKGLYLVSIITDMGRSTKKLVIE